MKAPTDEQITTAAYELGLGTVGLSRAFLTGAKWALSWSAQHIPQETHDDSNGRAFFISRHEIDTRFKDAAKFLLDCYERFQSLVTPRSAGGDDLVLLWREDYEELMRRPAAVSADSASGLHSDLNSEGSQR